MAFQLLKLPNNAIKCILHQTDFLSLVGISLCSSKCKKHVRSLNLKISRVRFEICQIYELILNIFSSNVYFCFHYKEGVSKPEYVRARCTMNVRDNDSRVYRKPQFELNDWIAHLLHITNEKAIQMVHISIMPDTELLHNCLKGLQWRKLSIKPPGLRLHSNVDLNKITPIRQLICYCDPFNGKNAFLMSNLEVLTVILSTGLKLDHVLCSSSRNLFLERSHLSGRNLNRFLKLWISGASPRLQYLKIHSDAQDISVELLLSGISYKGMAQGERRKVKIEYDCDQQPSMETIEDGFDIIRRDHTKATVLLKKYNEHSFFELILWNLYIN